VDTKGESRVQVERIESDIEQHIGQPEWAALCALLDSALQVVCRFVPSASASITLVNGDGSFVSHNATDDIAGMLEHTHDGDGTLTEDEPALSIPLRSREKTYGALNVYTTRRDPISDSETEFARTLADHIANALALVDASALNLQLQEAIGTRQLIGEAKGILMSSERCSREEAFDILRRASQRTNRKLRDIAHDIVDAAERRAQDPA
jgi:transcriptional regulator with GAF, ATPase, and Fis domain